MKCCTWIITLRVLSILETLNFFFIISLAIECFFFLWIFYLLWLWLRFINLLHLLLLLLLLSTCERIYTFGLRFNFKSIVILNIILFLIQSTKRWIVLYLWVFILVYHSCVYNFLVIIKMISNYIQIKNFNSELLCIYLR